MIDKKLHKNILIYDISYKTSIGSKPLCIRFDQIDWYIRIYDGTRYFTNTEYWKIWYNLQQNQTSYKSKKWYHIYFFSLFCENQSWFFTYRENIYFV